MGKRQGGGPRRSPRSPLRAEPAGPGASDPRGSETWLLLPLTLTTLAPRRWQEGSVSQEVCKLRWLLLRTPARPHATCSFCHKNDPTPGLDCSFKPRPRPLLSAMTAGGESRAVHALLHPVLRVARTEHWGSPAQRGKEMSQAPGLLLQVWF